jgi:RimJ/RimL family protein N-acetyltransferase
VTVEQLETQRLVLEPIAPAHAAVLYPLLSDPSLYEFLDGDPPASAAALEERYRFWSAGSSPDGREVWLNWAARLRGTDTHVGWFQATVYPGGEAHIAYLVFVPYQRKGFAREACAGVVRYLCSDFHVTKIVATADPRNTPSIALARSLGMTATESPGPGADVTLEMPCPSDSSI